jgi:transcriptional regulator with XRE-family HTH domain
MWELRKAVEEAIAASGKSAAQIARDGGIDENTISRLRTGTQDNPELATLLAFARGAGITPAALLAQPFAITPRDEKDLEQFRDWINTKLATINALAEPNAKVLRRPAVLRDRAADRPQRGDTPFGTDANLLFEAIGDSMIGDGILPGDTLYAKPADMSSPLGKVVACQIADDVFVKRLVFEEGRRLLLSANPRYRPITVEAFEIHGIVLGRVGRVRT